MLIFKKKFIWVIWKEFKNYRKKKKKKPDIL